MTGTVWIHQFDHEENVDDGSAAALYFGKETVEYYALDNNLKVLRLIEKLQYRVVGQKLSIGIKEGVLGDNYLTFKMNDTIGLTRRLQICLLHKIANR